MTKWQLPQGVEYPIEVSIVNFKGDSEIGFTSVEYTIDDSLQLNKMLAALRIRKDNGNGRRTKAGYPKVFK